MAYLHEMVVFVRVAEAGSFSEAARGLAMTPSAVSRQVSRLERAMGVKLLHRTTRQMQLTEVGLDVLAHGREMVESARAAVQVADGHMRAPQGLVRLGAPKAFARHVLQPHLLSFLARYPEVDVHVIVDDGLIEAWGENVDLVVQLTDEPPQTMVARRLMPVRQWLVASPDYLKAHGAIALPEHLAGHSCLCLGEKDRDSRWRFSKGQEAREVHVQGRFAINYSEMRLDAIMAGLGVGYVPDFIARACMADGQLVRLLADWTFEADYQGMAYLLFAASRHMPPKVRVLIEHLLQALKVPQ
ncbi:MAG: LysR family transcriptional regulator [Comamonas sp.]